MPEIKIEKTDADYFLKPLYSYDISGLVVSNVTTGSIFDVGRKAFAPDLLNFKDVCLVWGQNIRNDSYRAFKFESQGYACYPIPKNQSLGKTALFQNQFFSNNHLLPKDDAVARTINSIRNGDQVHIKGYLVNERIVYKQSGGSVSRRSSVTRDDQGDGACEIVLVESVEILKRGSPLFHFLFYVSGVFAFLAWLFLILLPLASKNQSEIYT